MAFLYTLGGTGEHVDGSLSWFTRRPIPPSAVLLGGVEPGVTESNG